MDEEGYCTLHDARRAFPGSLAAPVHPRPAAQWLAHANAVFDVAWGDGDRVVVTASGDQRARVWDTATQQPLATLAGHAGSVKAAAVAGCAPWCVATGARDGALCVWDTRAPRQPVAALPGGPHAGPAVADAIRPAAMVQARGRGRTGARGADAPAPASRARTRSTCPRRAWRAPPGGRAPGRGAGVRGDPPPHAPRPRRAPPAPATRRV